MSNRSKSTKSNRVSNFSYTIEVSFDATRNNQIIVRYLEMRTCMQNFSTKKISIELKSSKYFSVLIQENGIVFRVESFNSALNQIAIFRNQILFDFTIVLNSFNSSANQLQNKNKKCLKIKHLYIQLMIDDR
jgi:hypothetical protein